MVSSGNIHAIETKGNRGIMPYEGYFELLVRLGVASCKVTQISLGFWIPCCGLRISLSVGLGFRIPILGRIPDFLVSGTWILDSHL